MPVSHVTLYTMAKRKRIVPLNQRAGSVGALVTAMRAGGIVHSYKRRRQRLITPYLTTRNRYRLRSFTRIKKKKKRRGQRVVANSSGTTHTTTRMIVRKTPARQKFMRKLFKTNPVLTKHINRFGFNWLGATAASKTIWYSVTHLKFNNVLDYFKRRVIKPEQTTGSTSNTFTSTTQLGNNPATTIYIGKCTFSYEIYNPTNYIITVYIYDLVCKHDTPFSISYSDATEIVSSAPENCMYKGSTSMVSASTANPIWSVSDPTAENSAYWNTVGMKPTDYHCFNTLWKVKGMKKIILPPASSHHHVVVFNPKKKLTLGGFLYPNENIYDSSDYRYKRGLGGLTQSTLFGFEGQVAVENDTETDNTSIGTLPGKIAVKCIKKINVYNFPLTVEQIISNNDLVSSWVNPKIFTDLIEQTPGVPVEDGPGD